MTAKLLIDLKARSLEVEGDIDFVRDVYSDFKDFLVHSMAEVPEGADDESASGEREKLSSPKTRRRSATRTTTKKAAGTDTAAIQVNPDNPTLDKNLNTTGIVEFYSQFQPKNHPEKILIFARFLKDSLGLEKVNVNEIYTCYSAVSEKPAAAFAQSFRDTSSKKFGYIDYNSPTDIVLTFIGNRYFEHELPRVS